MINGKTLRETMMNKTRVNNTNMAAGLNNPFGGFMQGVANVVQKKMDAKCQGTRCGSTKVKGGW